MAGHSQFANIKHRKGAQDKKRAKMFTKAGREIIVAAKIGLPDPEYNPRLRAAILAARAINMPKDRIDGAIKKAIGATDADNYEEMRYEGYAPGGVAIIVEALTDNRNRTASDVRSAFTKAGGNMGAEGSVSFSFERVGIIQYPADKASADAMFEAALEAGADNCESGSSLHEITCQPNNLNEVRDALANKFGDAEVGRLGWVPKNTVAVDEATAANIIDFIETLEDNDDVQQVFANYSISEEIAQKLAARG